MDWISSLLLATVRLAIPVLLISLAELYGQRAGMVNIGLEGLASIGALVGFLVCYVTGSNWLGLLCGALAGVIVNMIYAFSTVTLCADHTVYGMAINIFAPALASFIYRVYFGTGSDLKQITGQAPVICKAKKSVANSKLREVMAIVSKVSLRGDVMYEFLDRLFNLALPRVRDFRGINPNSFDGRGNYSMGIKEQLIFPEIDYDKIDKVRGMDICFVTTANTDEEARELLTLMGAPFSK